MYSDIMETEHVGIPTPRKGEQTKIHEHHIHAALSHHKTKSAQHLHTSPFTVCNARCRRSHDVAIHCLQCTMSLFARCRHSLSATACLLCRLRCLTVAVEGAASSSLEHTPPPPPPPTALDPGTVRGIGFWLRILHGKCISRHDSTSAPPRK